MKIIPYAILLLLVSTVLPAFCQTPAQEYYITINGNLYVPINNPEKGMYPIFGYDKETDSKILIGGLGFGISGIKSVQPKINLKGQANLSKHTYWNKALEFTNATGSPIGAFVSGSSDYTLGITVTAHYFLSNKISVGTGLGTQIMLISLSRMPEINDVKKSLAVNRFYQPVIPTLPVELSGKFQKKIITIRYEHGLINRYKGELKNYQKDKFGLLTFELGFKIKQ